MWSTLDDSQICRFTSDAKDKPMGEFIAFFSNWIDPWLSRIRILGTFIVHCFMSYICYSLIYNIFRLSLKIILQNVILFKIYRADLMPRSVNSQRPITSLCFIHSLYPVFVTHIVDMPYSNNSWSLTEFKDELKRELNSSADHHVWISQSCRNRILLNVHHMLTFGLTLLIDFRLETSQR